LGPLDPIVNLYFHYYSYGYYPSTLANLTLILLFSEMLKFSKTISSKSKNIVKENNEYLGIFHFLKWIFQNQLIIQRTCAEMAKVLRMSLHKLPRWCALKDMFHADEDCEE